VRSRWGEYVRDLRHRVAVGSAKQILIERFDQSSANRSVQDSCGDGDRLLIAPENPLAVTVLPQTAPGRPVVLFRRLLFERRDEASEIGVSTHAFCEEVEAAGQEAVRWN